MIVPSAVSEILDFTQIIRAFVGCEIWPPRRWVGLLGINVRMRAYRKRSLCWWRKPAYDGGWRSNHVV